MAQGRDRDRQGTQRSNQRSGGKQRPWSVLFPRNYTTAEGEERTEFLRIGYAFKMRDREGFSVEILGVKVVIMPQRDREEPGSDG
jgi:hypothetical protein